MPLAALPLLLAAAAAAPAPTMVDAARLALAEGCVPHTIARRPIARKNAAALLKAGIRLDAPVPEWARTGREEWGAVVPAAMDSAEGPVWISAFPAGPCSILLASGGRHRADAEALLRLVETPGNGFAKIDEIRDADTVTRFYDSPLKPRGTLRLTLTATTDAAPKGGETIILSTTRID